MNTDTTCATATADGSLCVQGAIESNGAADIAGNLTVGGSATLASLSMDSIDFGDSGTAPTCNSTNRGVLWFDESASGDWDTFRLCQKDENDAYAYHDLAPREKQFTTLNGGTTVTALEEWKHPDFDVDTENAAVYMKMTHRGEGQDDFIYGIFFEITGQNITGGSATKVLHYGQGDAHYVALFHDITVHGSSGGVGYEAAMFADGETGFLGSYQGNGGFADADPNQTNSLPFEALVHDDGATPVTPLYQNHTRGLFRATNTLGNSFVADLSEYIPTPGVAVYSIISPSNDANDPGRQIWVVHDNGEVHQKGAVATSGAQNNAAPAYKWRSAYWDGDSDEIYDFLIQPGISGAPTPTPTATIAFQKVIGGTPQSAETIMILDNTGFDFQTNDMTNVGSISFETDTDTGLDMQTKDAVNFGDLTFTSNVTIDTQSAAITTVDTITFETVNETGLDLQTKDIINAGSITMRAGGDAFDMQDGTITNCQSISPLASDFFQMGHHINITSTSTPAGTTQTIDWNSGNSHQLDLGSASGNVTLTLSNPGQSGEYTIRIHNNGNSRNVIWPASVLWQGGTAPTITVGAGAEDLIRLHWDGTQYFAVAYQDFQ